MLLRIIASWILLTKLKHIDGRQLEATSPYIHLGNGGSWLTIEGDDLNDTNVDELLGSLNDDTIREIDIINLSNKRLTRIPPNIRKFYNLEYLYLTDNQITAIECRTFDGLNKLKLIDITSNHLTTINNRAFEGLKNLIRVDLENNQLTTIESETFCDLTSLRTINLGNNHLVIIKEEAFIELPSLQTINLGNNQLTTINRNVFIKIPNLLALILKDNRLIMIDSSVFEVLENLECLNLQNNQLSALPDSILNLNQSYIAIDIRDNPNFFLESGDGTLGLEDLRRTPNFILVCDKNQLKKVMFVDLEFINEYLKRQSLHWNLNKFKELRLPEAKDYTVSMNEMLKIVDKIFTVEYKGNCFMRFINLVLSKLMKNNISKLEDIKDYIKRIHKKEVTTRRKHSMIDEKDFPIARKLLGNILKHLEELTDSGHEGQARTTLAELSDAMNNGYHEQIAALNDAYALINGDYKSQSNNIVDILEHRITVLKDLKFRSLVTAQKSPHNVHILNHWTNKMKDILGFTVNLPIKAEDSLNDDPFGGDSILVLKYFLDGVFAPDKIIDILTEEINSTNEMKNAFLSFICKDKTLLSLLSSKKESEDEDVLSPDSVLYKMDMTKEVVEHALIKMNLLIGNGDGNSVRN